MSNLDAALADARNAVAKNQPPSFAKAVYETGIDDLAKSKRRDGETHAQTVSRLLDEDSDAQSLYTAAFNAETAELVERAG